MNSGVSYRTSLVKLQKTSSLVKMREIADETGVCKSVFYRIVRKELNYRKICGRWVPKKSTVEQFHLYTSKEKLSRCENEGHFLERIITYCDDTWVHYYTPEGKHNSMTWKHSNSLVTKKFKQTISAKKNQRPQFLVLQRNILKR